MQAEPDKSESASESSPPLRSAPPRAAPSYIHPVTLGFNDDLEDRFQEHSFETHGVYRRWVLILAIVLFGAGTYSDLEVLQPHFHLLLPLRITGVLSLVIPLLVGMSRRNGHLMRWLVPLGALGVGLSYVAIIWRVPVALEHFYEYGLFAIVMVFYTVMRLGFVMSAVVGLTVSGAFIAALFVVQPPEGQMIAMWGLLVPLNILGMAAAYAMERYDRISFRQASLLKRSQSDLRNEIRRRNKTAKELRAASQRADAANLAKSEFLARMSHEIRTPMNGVIGMNDLLLSTPLSGSQRELAETVKGSGQALLQIINDILDFSKIEAHQMRLHIEPMDLRRTVEDVARLLGVQAEEKGLVLKTEYSKNVPAAVLGDSGRLRQVLLNLVGNGIKFTSKGEVSISVSFEGPETVQIEVNDTGPGIRVDAIQRLFDPFEQLENRSQGGTGLGLAITRQLVFLMDGELYVESEVGQGSTFSFTARLPTTEAQAPAASMQASRTFDLQPHILVAEDNRVNQAVIKGMLRRMGCRVTLVGDGEQAVAAHQQQAFDAIIMDVRMPKLDGLEATRLIRESPGGLEVPIIALTADALDDSRRACSEAGMAGYLCKPVASEVLYDTLMRFIGPAPQAGTSDQVIGAPVDESGDAVPAENLSSQRDLPKFQLRT